MRRSSLLAGREALEDLVLADAQAVLAAARAPARTSSARGGRAGRARRRRAGSSCEGPWRAHYSKRCNFCVTSNAHRIYAPACILLGMPLLAHPRQPRWDARLGARSSSSAASLFLDGLDVSMVGVALPSIERRPAPHDLAAAVDRLRLRARLRRPAAARRAHRRPARPAAGAARRAGRLHASPRPSAASSTTARCSSSRASSRAPPPRSPRPAGLSIITTTFAEGPARNRALSIYTATGASGFSLGLVLGGLLTELGWRWTFLLPVPIALALLVVGAARDPARPRRRARRAGASTSPAR